MKRRLVLGVAVASGLALVPAVASAKGVTQASCSGPGLTRRPNMRDPLGGHFESRTSRRCIAALTAAVTFALVALAPIGAASATHQSRLRSAARCEQRPKPLRGTHLPASIRGAADQRGLVGEGVLWARPVDHVEFMPSLSDPSTGVWSTKFAWLRRVAGTLTVTGTRLHGPGTFQAGLAPVESYAATGFLPSTPTFSTGGCWRVIGRLRASKVVLFFKVDDSQRAICADLARQRTTIQEINNPANDRLEFVIEAALRAHNCTGETPSR